MLNLKRLAQITPALVLVALAIPTSASAQATRTWVSGVGDDANPCSRTAPCKTFAGAISKTAAGGEINCLDPGGFGGVTITKALTIKCHYTEGGVLVSGTNAIVVNAPAADTVTLRGLDINGIGTGATTSLSGVKVLSASKVNIFDSEVYRFRAGVAVVPTSTFAKVTIKNTHIHDNGIGVITAPGNNTITRVATVIRNSDVQANNCGIVTGSGGTNASTPDSSLSCGTVAVGAINKPAHSYIYNTGIQHNGTGVFTRGTGASSDLAYSEIVRNDMGLDHLESGIIRGTSPGTNSFNDNTASDATNGTVTLVKRVAKRR
jgi:hypothetical protein